MNLFFSIVLALVIIDFTIFGFLPYIFKIHPPYRHLLSEGVLLRDDTRNWCLSWERTRVKSLILTNNHLILRTSLLTSVINIEISSIIKCVVKRIRRGRSKITVYFLVDKKTSKFSFKTDKTDKWVSYLRKLGVKVIEVN